MKRQRVVHWKFFDSYTSESDLTAQQSRPFPDSSDVPQGFENSERIGDKIFVKSLLLHWSTQAARPTVFSSFGSSVFIAGSVRIVVVLDTASASAASGYDEIFDVTSGSVVDAMPIIAETPNFKILHDETRVLQSRHAVLSGATSYFLSDDDYFRVEVDVNEYFWFRSNDATGASHLGNQLLVFLAIGAQRLRYIRLRTRLVYCDH